MNSKDITSGGTFNATSFVGALTGNASSATTASACSGNSATATTATTATNATNTEITADATNATFYPTFVSGTSGNLPQKVDGDLTYNPSTNTFTITNLSLTNMNTLTTKGDLLSRTSSALSRVPVGTDGQYLKADSAQTNGLSWGTLGVKISVASQAYQYYDYPTSPIYSFPSGVNLYNLVSIVAQEGVNNILYIQQIGLGNQSGVFGINQFRITAYLENGVHLDPYTLKFFYYS